MGFKPPQGNWRGPAELGWGEMHPENRGASGCCRGSLGAGELGMCRCMGTTCARSRRGTCTWCLWDGVRLAWGLHDPRVRDGSGCSHGLAAAVRMQVLPAPLTLYPAPHTLHLAPHPAPMPRSGKDSGQLDIPWDRDFGCSLPGPEGCGANWVGGTIPCPPALPPCPSHEDEFPLLLFIPW